MVGGPIRRRLTASVREIVFGLEDSLVSTLGTVTGVAVGSGDIFVVLLTGTVLVFVEALSMAAGSYLSSKSAKEMYEDRHRQDASRVLHEKVSSRESLQAMFERKGFSRSEIKAAVDAVLRERKVWLHEVRRTEYRLLPAVSPSPEFAGFVMGAFYVMGGFIPLVPYFIFPIALAVPVAVTLTVICLFGVGVLKARLTNGQALKSGIEMLMVSLGAAVLGFVIGRAVAVAAGVEPSFM